MLQELYFAYYGELPLLTDKTLTFSWHEGFRWCAFWYTLNRILHTFICMGAMIENPIVMQNVESELVVSIYYV